MTWKKYGLIVDPGGQRDWMVTHAMLPTALHLKDDMYRIYFSGRDSKNQSRIGYVEVDINEPNKVLYLSDKPVLDLGKIGCFDDVGVSPTCVVRHREFVYLYYLGWNKGSAVKVSEMSGLAISKDGGKAFERWSAVPIMDRTEKEPYLISVISYILIDKYGRWNMWYDGSDGWVTPDLPKYNIKYADSLDGIHWERNQTVSIDYKDPDETRVSRASVLAGNSVYEMWYCYAKNDGYRMGYASLPVVEEYPVINREFVRKDAQVGIDVASSGWDSEMICYPNVFVHRGKKYMLYCGNSYGKTGFGYAVWEE